jgi:tetratricopeptide (TPR) repeat protein
MTGAEIQFRRALASQPESFAAYMNLANVLAQTARLEEAADCFQNAVRLKPDLAEGYVGLAYVMQAMSNYRESVTYCQKALNINPGFAGAHHIMATSQVALGEFDDAKLSFERALQLRPNYTDARLGLASVLLTQGNPEVARANCDKALELEPSNTDAIAMSAHIAIQVGDADRAFQLLSPLIKSGVQQVNVAVAFAMISKDLGRQSEAITLMETALESNPALNVTARLNLHFNLGMLYDNTGQYDRAFFHYQQGNKLKPLSFNQADYAHVVVRIIVNHAPDTMARMPRARVQSDRPIFIVGMVRSGTSLVEQILASHPAIYGAGELPAITEIARALPGLLGTNDRYPEFLPMLNQEAVNSMACRYLERLNQIAPGASRITDKSLATLCIWA